MLYYKNVIDGQVAGYTESSHSLNIANFFEITKEEYLQLGGVLHDSGNDMPKSDGDSASKLISALLD